MYPNSALSVWQMTLMAVVPFTLLVVWLVAVFVAAREPRGRDLAAAASPHESAAAGTGQPEPEHSPADRMAA